MLHHAIEQLVSGDFNARWSASKTLKSMGEDAYPSLLPLLKSNHQDSDLLLFIVDILGSSSRPEAILALVNLLSDCNDDEVRERTILTLAQQGDTYIQELYPYLDHPSLQGTVLKAFIQMRHPATIKGFLHCLEHPDGEIRALAFEGIGQFHHPEIISRLIQGLQDFQPHIRGLCLKALGMRGESDIDPGVIKAVAPLLYDMNAEVCTLASKALGRFNHSLALEHLWQRLLDQPKDQPVGQPAISPLTPALIQALGWSGHPEGVQYLLKLLDMLGDKSRPLGQSWPPSLVLEIIQTLGSLNEPKLFETIEHGLLPLLDLEVEPFGTVSVKQGLAMAIAQLGQEHSISPLIQLLKIDQDRLRLHVVAALKQINRESSYETLLEMSRDSGLDPALKRGIAIALKEW